MNIWISEFPSIRTVSPQEQLRAFQRKDSGIQRNTEVY